MCVVPNNNSDDYRNSMSPNERQLQGNVSSVFIGQSYTTLRIWILYFDKTKYGSFWNSLN